MLERQPIQDSALNQNEVENIPTLNLKTFKVYGELERTKGLEPLHETEISDQARKKLEAWGSPPEYVQEFTSSFRYDLVLEKVKRLAETEKSINVYKIGEREHVDLSALLDKDGRFDGHCLNIAGQWVAQSHKSKLIEELNRNLKVGSKVAPMLYVGLSETHFNTYLDTHCWNGLALVGPDGKVIEGEEIYIDAAFQTIHTKEESKYKEPKAYLDPKNIKTEKEYTVQIGLVYVNGDSFTSSTLENVILGVSSDHKKYVYGLGFARDHKTKAIMPVLERTYQDGSRDNYIIYNNKMLTACRIEDSDEDSVEASDKSTEASDEDSVEASDKSTEASTQDMEEAKEILKIAAGLNFDENMPTE